MATPHSKAPGELPLAGVHMVEFGHSVAAPYAAQILADLGADVLKIEKPQGDDARHWGPPFLDGTAATFQALNRNKRSVVANLRDPVQRDRLRQHIAKHADVVLQNLRPGQADALGLGGTDLRALQPRLVYCNLGAFGARGPLADKPGYDPLMQAFGGIMSVVGEAGRPAVRVGPSIIDCGTAMWAALGIVSALYKRRDSGVGAVVDVSLFETAAAWMGTHVAQFGGSGQLPQKAGSGQVGIVPYRAYATRDGELVVAAGNDGLFARLCQVLGHAEWTTDARFASNPLRVQHAQTLYALIEPCLLERSTAEWRAALEAAGVPCAPVQNVQQMLDHPQTRALGIAQALPGGSAPVIGLPISFDGQRPIARSGAPALGAHNADVFGTSAPNLPTPDPTPTPP
jgi:crotonobetainyl-CoA:carnitine CoA-transferase CaiB-like acyl-CoA transferase